MIGSITCAYRNWSSNSYDFVSKWAPLWTTTFWGSNGKRFASSAINISFDDPTISIYWNRIRGLYGTRFPDNPLVFFDFTAENQSESPFTGRGTEVKVVYQVTSLLGGEAHPMHIHGYSFYVVGWGLGNSKATRDPLRYNLKNPPLKNTIGVPRNGWIALRFAAHNPGMCLIDSTFWINNFDKLFPNS